MLPCLTKGEIDAILQTAMRAPTAGAMMPYSIIEIEDIVVKKDLTVTYDNQLFIASAPNILLFSADYQRQRCTGYHCMADSQHPNHTPEITEKLTYA